MCLARNHEALCVAGAVTMQRVPHTGVSFLSIFFKQLHEGCVGSLTQGVGLGFLVLFANVDGPSSSFNSAVKDKTWQLSESLDGSETCFPWKLSPNRICSKPILQTADQGIKERDLLNHLLFTPFRNFSYG